MMFVRVVLVDLPEDGRGVTGCTLFPGEETAWLPAYTLGERELRSRKNANCGVGILRRSEPSNPLVPVLKCWVVNLSPTFAGRDFTLCKL
jgi:hypothetical protein